MITRLSSLAAAEYFRFHDSQSLLIPQYIKIVLKADDECGVILSVDHYSLRTDASAFYDVLKK